MSESEPLGDNLIAPDWMPPEIDSGVATSARIYSYLLGGKDHFQADREAAEKALKAMPEARDFALTNRAFLTRAVRHLANEGITQFLDIGIGLPAPGGTAETASAVWPDAQIVGVDIDPVVLAHARAHGDDPAPAGATVIAGDVRRPTGILEHPEVRARLDFTRPIAVMLVAVMHFIVDDEDPYGVVRTLMDAVPPGSVLVLSHVTGDLDPERVQATAKAYDKSAVKTAVRSGKEIAAFFDGLDLLDPGMVLLARWRPDTEVDAKADRIGMYGGVARKN
jgi:trans-aconitate methyltransferase